MSVYTIGAHNLPAAEVILVKTLVRLFSHDPEFRWRFADTGPYDAVIVDSQHTEARPPSGLALVTLSLAPASASPRPNTICRPIRAEQLQAWMRSQEAVLRGLGRVLLGSEPKCAPARGGLRFKLRRWPSAALLGNDPKRIRLASLLARRALGARELSSISRLPPEQCLAFVDTLREAGLVEIQDTNPRPPAAPPSFGLGLISSLRRRLGL